MPPSSYAKEQFRLSRELQYGVLGTPVWKRLMSLGIDLETNFDTDPFIPSGATAPTIVVLNDDYTTGDVSGRSDYNGIIYPYGSLFGDPVITTPGGGTISRQHVFTYDGFSTLYPVSYAVDSGTAAAAERVLGCIFNGLKIGGSRGGNDFSSNLWGKDLNLSPQLGGTTNEVQTLTITGTPTAGSFTLTLDGQTTAPILFSATAAAVQAALLLLPNIAPNGVTVTGGPGPGTPYIVTFTGRLAGINVNAMTAAHTFTGGTTPTIAVTTTTPGADAVIEIPAQPIFPLHTSVYMDDTWAALGTTKLLELYEYGLEFGERTMRTRPLNAARTSDNVIEKGDQEHTVTLNFGVDPVERGLLTTIRAGAKKFFRIEAVGPIIEGTIPYRHRADLCLLMTKAGKRSDRESVLSREWTGQISRDSTSGFASQVTVVNTLTGL
jgi:hypothetical protein